jgi:biotin operon repressor
VTRSLPRRMIKLLEDRGRLTSVEIGLELGISRRQVRETAQHIRKNGLAQLSSSSRKPYGYWIGSDGLEHLRRRALIALHEYNVQKRMVRRQELRVQGELL